MNRKRTLVEAFAVSRSESNPKALTKLKEKNLKTKVIYFEKIINKVKNKLNHLKTKSYGKV